MATLPGSIFDLLGGNPAQQEEDEFGSLANYGINTGEGATNAANQYYGGILSGNPEEIAQTLAPEISAGNQQVQQQAQTNAEFGNRGGGTNSATQAAKSQERGNIINLIGGLQQGAAAGEAGIGSDMLSQGSGNLGNEADLAIDNRNREVGDINGIGQGVGELAERLPNIISQFEGSGVQPFSSVNGPYDPLGLNAPPTSDLSSLENQGDENLINQMFQ